MLRKLRRLWTLANCNHPPGVRVTFYTTGAELAVCPNCGRVVSTLYRGRLLGPEPLIPVGPVEDYDGARVAMDQ